MASIEFIAFSNVKSYTIIELKIPLFYICTRMLLTLHLSTGVAVNPPPISQWVCYWGAAEQQRQSLMELHKSRLIKLSLGSISIYYEYAEDIYDTSPVPGGGVQLMV